ncbi:MAG: CoA transferase, partial [Phycicoccus sp.]
LGLELHGGQWDSGSWPAHREALAAAFATRTRDEWVAVFEGTDACVAPVLTLGEAPRHPHLAARGTFAEVDGGMTPRVAPRFSATPGLEPGHERTPGADTTAYLTSHGFDADEVAALVAGGVLLQA